MLLLVQTSVRSQLEHGATRYFAIIALWGQQSLPDGFLHHSGHN